MELDPQYLLTMQRKARNAALARGWKNIADDFAAQVVIDLIEGRPGNIDWLFTDFLRREYGDTRSLSGSQRSADRLSGRSLDQPAGCESEMLLSECIGSPEPDPEPLGSSWRDRVVLFGRSAIIARLYLDLEFTEQEIGEIFGVSMSRISQLLRPIKKTIEKAAIVEEIGDIYRSDKEYSKLEIQWIRI